MKILVVGGLGSIGSRYCAILRYLGVPYQIHDTEYRFGYEGYDLGKYEFDKMLIASPTATHAKYCFEAIKLRKPFLCEKPLCRDVQTCGQIIGDAILSGVKGNVVCNYNFTPLRKIKRPRIHYNYYRTGPDGLYWDCSQLLFVDPNAELLTTSPMWTCRYNDWNEITLEDVEKSYVYMMRQWLMDGELWTLEDGLEMTENVLRRINESPIGNSSANA